MLQRTKQHGLFLKFLYEANAQQKKELVKMATEEQLKTMNLYLGHPAVTPYYRTKLKAHKSLLQSLADRSVDNKDIKTLLRRHPEAISLILKPHWKRNGRGIRSREKITHDQMKLRQNDKKEVRDQGTNTEISDEKDSFIESQPLPQLKSVRPDLR